MGKFQQTLVLGGAGALAAISLLLAAGGATDNGLTQNGKIFAAVTGAAIPPTAFIGLRFANVI